MEEAQSFRLHHGGKISWFNSHRVFLNQNHALRKDHKNFLKGQTVKRRPPTFRMGEEILNQISELAIRKVTEMDAEEVNRRICKSCGWKKSIFWDLPYWSSNLIRHNLDVMHIEKNVFDNVFNTVLNVKDNPKARLNMVEYCDRPQLAKNASGSYPKAAYTIDKAATYILFDWVKGLMFPDGYVSNLSRCLYTTKYRLFGMKSHDCHVFMQRLMSIAFHELLPNNVWQAVTELSLFFKDLSSITLRVAEMERLEGLLDLYNTDGCILSRDVEGNLSIFTHRGRLWGEAKKRNLSLDEIKAAQTYILLNCKEVEPFVSMYVERLQEELPNLSQDQIDESLRTYFAEWFKGYVHCNHSENEFLRSLAHGPLISAKYHSMYFVNGYKFHTDCHGSARSTMNSGVCITDLNVGDYYGKIQELKQVEYREEPLKQTVLFKCEWFDPTINVGVKKHNEYKLVDVNHRRRFKKYEPFILAMQATQGCYVSYPSKKKDKDDWLSVLKVKPQNIIQLPDEEAPTISELNLPFQVDEVEVHDRNMNIVVDESILLHDPNGELIEMDEPFDDGLLPEHHETEEEYETEETEEDEEEFEEEIDSD
ncbi:uncharacterized protein LOC107790290 isoform X3 [Nicotiana tabacum]|uniref:Uncharacterized protein LOC107790290 isoform X3 n=1 Tax=Nicotiana tabacum TaxID=4097 RepID=A0AC58TA15_TOBAC